MTTRHLLRYAAFALLIGLYGCERDEVSASGSDEMVLRSVATRTAEESTTHPLSAGVETGIFASLPGSLNYFASNLHYISDGRVLVAASEKLKLPEGVTSAMAYAYAPYSATNVQYGFLEIAVETDQNANGTAGSDLLWGAASIERENSLTTFSMERKMSLVRINLSSKAEADLSGAKIELLGLSCTARLELRTGTISMTDYSSSTIRARQVESTSYEAVILPQTLSVSKEFIRVTVRNRSYVFTVSPKTFVAGKVYDFDISVRDDISVPLNCELTVLYDGKTLGNSLVIPAAGPDKEIEITTIPQLFNTYKLRNESGEECWARIISIGIGSPNQIKESDRYSKLHFEENFGPERKMTLEFYDIKEPRAVYKQVMVTQRAATDYLNLSTQTISADKMGTVYDIPFEVNATSNLSWTVDSTDSWIDVTYTAGVKNQLIKIDLEINNTGAARSGAVRLMAGGREVKRIQVNQSAVESATFTLRYELNFDLTTYGNWFKHNGQYYPDEAHVYNYYPSEYGDETAKIQSSQPFGFVVDEPGSFNKIEVRGFRHDKFFTVRNYSGKATTIRNANMSVTCYRISYPFFRSFRVDIPIPAGVKRHQMVRLYMQFIDTQHIMYYPIPTIQTTIIDQ